MNYVYDHYDYPIPSPVAIIFLSLSVNGISICECCNVVYAKYDVKFHSILVSSDKYRFYLDDNPPPKLSKRWFSLKWHGMLDEDSIARRALDRDRSGQY